MTAVEFEIAGLTDSLKKASQIAPVKGNQLEKFAGLLLEILPETDETAATVILRATNGDVFYREWITPNSIEGDPITWRLPSKLVANVVAQLPQSKVVRFEDSEDVSRVEITCGKLKATTRKMIPDTYPDWDYIDQDEMFQMPGFGQTLEEVGWAVANDHPPFNGIRITDEMMFGCDKYRLARAPLELDLPEPITVPASVLAPIIKHVVDTKVMVTEHHLCLMPNDRTEILCTIFGEEYPSVDRIINTEFTHSIEFDKSVVKDILDRVMAAGSKDRQYGLDVIIGEETLEVGITDEDHQINDSLYIEGQADHNLTHFSFSPMNFTEPISKAPNGTITLKYTAGNPKKMVKFEADGMFEVWVAPRIKSSVTS